METNLEGPLLRLEGVSILLQTPESTIRNWIRTKGMPHIKIGRRLLFDKAKVLEWVNRFSKIQENASQADPES